MSDWISVKTRLPDHGQQVWFFRPHTNIFTGPDNEPVHQGRATFYHGKIPGPGDSISADDQHGNNKVPWSWHADGVHLLGQYVSHWMPLPADPEVSADLLDGG